MREYDFIAIGGGSGGIATMNRAAEYGAKTAVIEGNLLGGTCVNIGCVPKKIMWYASQISEAIHKYGPDYGFDTGAHKIDFPTLLKNRDAYVERSRNSYQAGFERRNVDVIEGFAKFVDNHTVEVNGELIRSKHILIATGAKPIRPRIPGAKLGDVSDTFFEWTELPEKVAVVGAGYIAIELAGVLHNLGVDTHLYVRYDTPLRKYDDIIIEGLMQEIEKDGPTLHTHAVSKAVEKNADGTLTLHLEDGRSEVFDKIIWAIGRTANIDGLNIEATDVKVSDKKFIIVDEYENSSVDGIYAVGDVTGKNMLTPVAIAAGRRLVGTVVQQQTERETGLRQHPDRDLQPPANRQHRIERKRRHREVWCRSGESIQIHLCIDVHGRYSPSPACEDETGLRRRKRKSRRPPRHRLRCR